MTGVPSSPSSSSPQEARPAQSGVDGAQVVETAGAVEAAGSAGDARVADAAGSTDSLEAADSAGTAGSADTTKVVDAAEATSTLDALGTATPGRRTVAEHVAVIDRLVGGLSVDREQIRIEDALGRLTADPVLSPVDLPLFRNSQMDGFAVAAADIAEVPVTLPVAATIAAAPGAPEMLTPGNTARIMTGAPVPRGADAVVPVELTRDTGDGRVTIERSQLAGDFVREAGSDIRAGDELIPAGTLLAPRHLAALAASGIADVTVTRRARIAIISSGAELVGPGSPAMPGQVYDANTAALTAAVVESGAQVALTLRTVDDAEPFRIALARAVGEADLVLTSGGVSKGAFEVVRDVLEPLGAEVTEVAMQPGGPQCTALVEGVPVISFPGNPVSAQVSFAVFLRPALRRLAGLPPVAPLSVALTQPVDSVAGKRQWLRGVRTSAGVTVVSGPGSHLVAAMAGADCLLDIPEAVTRLEAGDKVEVLPL